MGMPNVDAALEAGRHGALYLAKPVDNARLVQAVSRAERLHRLAVTKRMAMDGLGFTPAGRATKDPHGRGRCRRCPLRSDPRRHRSFATKRPARRPMSLGDHDVSGGPRDLALQLLRIQGIQGTNA